MKSDAQGATPIRVGIDVGGTFTDLAALVDGAVVTAKVPSTPRDPSRGVLKVLDSAQLDANQIGTLAHGMTVATNALLERRGARTALVTTAGFRDIVEIGRQSRPALYDLTCAPPAPLVPRHLRITVRERMGPEGVISPLDTGSVRQAVQELRRAEVDSVAVCLLFGFLHPEHERQVGEAIRNALPGVHVSLSSDVLPEFREYERLSTTLADAYLAPMLSRYLARLRAALSGSGGPLPRIMQSSGGVAELDSDGLGAKCVLSGPAGGVVGAVYSAGASGYADLLTFDMGGTSTDVCPILDGVIQTRTDSHVAGVPLRHPMVDVHTVSAGGGSIATVDSGGALQVGPQSAGAEPGPAAYGRGGEDPTVVDANLVLGYLSDGARLGGEVTLNRALADSALAQLGAPLGLDATETALAVVKVANAQMVRALRVISVERGLDPRDFALVAFGGAGGLHACALAQELGMRTVLLPRASGVLSALGLAVSPVRRDYQQPLFGDLRDVDADRWASAFAAMEDAASRDLHQPAMRRFADLRYRRQSFELTVPADPLEGLRERFDEAHRAHYGYDVTDAHVELVSVRLVATEAANPPALEEQPVPDGDATVITRPLCVDGSWVEASLIDRERMGTGSEVAGPAIIEFREATCVVRPGWHGVVDNTGMLVLKRS